MSMRRNNAIISETVRKNHPKVFAEIERFMKEKFGEKEYKLTSLEELPDESDEVKRVLRTDARFVCVHTDDDIALWIDEICECGVPTVVIRGDKIPDNRLKVWTGILTRLTKEKTDPPAKGVDCSDMFYPISEAEAKDVRGAIKWVHNFYHALKEKAMEAAEREIRDAKTLSDLMNRMASLH